MQSKSILRVEIYRNDVGCSRAAYFVRQMRGNHGLSNTTLRRGYADKGHIFLLLPKTCLRSYQRRNIPCSRLEGSLICGARDLNRPKKSARGSSRHPDSLVATSLTGAPGAIGGNLVCIAGAGRLVMGCARSGTGLTASCAGATAGEAAKAEDCSVEWRGKTLLSAGAGRDAGFSAGGSDAAIRDKALKS